MEVLVMAIVGVSLSVCSWLINRSVAITEGNNKQFGFFGALVQLVAAITMLALEVEAFSLASLTIGIIGGFSVSVGYYLVMLLCFTMGPSGPVVLAHNLGMLWPITIELFLFGSEDGLYKTIVGIIAMVISLAMITVNFNDFKTRNILNNRYIVFLFIGWASSGVYLTCANVAGRLLPNTSISFLLGTALAIAIVLGILIKIKKQNYFIKTGWYKNLIDGLIVTVSIPIVFFLLERVPGTTVFPILNGTPIIIITLLGNFLFKERLKINGWIAIVIGVWAIVLLS